MLETTLILLIANSIGLYLCSKVLSRDRDRVKFSAALLITILVLAIMNIGFDFPRAFAAAERDFAMFNAMLSFSVVLLFFGGLFLTSTLLTDGWIRALGVWIASILLFAFPAALLYQHVLVGEETAARIERSGQIADQILMRAMGGEEDAAEKSR